MRTGILAPVGLWSERCEWPTIGAGRAAWLVLAKETIVTTAFLVIGLVGLGLLAVSVVFGNLLDGLLDALDLDLGDGELVGDGMLSSAAIATFIAGFGLAGWLALEAGALATWVAIIIALVVAFLLAIVAGKAVGAAMHMQTDRTPTQDDLLGRLGVVTSPIPPGGLGQIRSERSGSPVKLSARSEEAPLPVGADVVVMEVLTETSVRVSTETAVFDDPPTQKELE